MACTSATFPKVCSTGGGSATNRTEAAAVARAVIEHARNSGNRSLGVGTFSVAQRDAILDELELLRRQNADTEEFFAPSRQEAFFVKNLENIQGDERDVIFISIGYARDSSGFMAMNFGSLSNDGGERRLNVLITRARICCRVFSSITSDDIDLQRGRSHGAQVLKTFLNYAATGVLGVPRQTDGEYGSEFERQVARAVTGLGFEVHPQVGSAGFFIDLAVVDPEVPGRYLLGIECDGAAYHRARWARDRDRLRQQVLEDHKWIIHRIWSTDWFHQPESQLRKVLAAIEQARIRLKRSHDDGDDGQGTNDDHGDPSDGPKTNDPSVVVEPPLPAATPGVAEESRVVEKILTALKNEKAPMGPTLLSVKTGFDNRMVQRALQELVSTGLVVATGADRNVRYSLVR